MSRPLITNHDVLSIVKEEVEHCWKNLAKELNPNRGKVEIISLEEEEDQERCNKVLESWCQNNGEEATIRELMHALNKNVINCLNLT